MTVTGHSALIGTKYTPANESETAVVAAFLKKLQGTNTRPHNRCKEVRLYCTGFSKIYRIKELVDLATFYSQSARTVPYIFVFEHPSQSPSFLRPVSNVALLPCRTQMNSVRQWHDKKRQCRVQTLNLGSEEDCFAEDHFKC